MLLKLYRCQTQVGEPTLAGETMEALVYATGVLDAVSIVKTLHGVQETRPVTVEEVPFSRGPIITRRQGWSWPE